MISDISRINLIILTGVLCLILSPVNTEAQTTGTQQSQNQQLPQTQTVQIEYYANANQKTRTFIDRISELPNTFNFNKSLRKGQVVNPDVNYLKWVLNSDSRTELTDNPNKTLTELNASFGPITKDAVKRFQNVYKDDILTPLGLTSPTGIVGSSTKAKLNWLLTQARSIAATKNMNFSNVYSNNYNSNNLANYSNDFVYFSNNNHPNNLNINQNISTSSSNQSTSSYTTYNGASSTVGTSRGLTSTPTGNTNISSTDSSNVGLGLGVLAVVGATALLSGGGEATQTAANTVVSQFGGKVISNIYCTCSQNYMITVYDLSLKMPLSIMFQPGFSSIKMNYNPTVGETVLGGYIRSTNVCLMYSGSHCNPIGFPVGSIDNVRGIGSTLEPVSI